MTSSILRISILLIVIFSVPLALTAEEVGSKLDLIRIADDMKYQNGLQFYRLKREDRALQEFNEYLEVFINGIHRKEVFATIAKIYFDQQEYPRSIQAYEDLYAEFPHSDEGVEAFFRTGLCYQKMGDEKRAREVFEILLRDYPDSHFAQRARIYLNISEILTEQKASQEINN
jgi:TolA-binding protein